jgi:hypothetical protein
MSGQHQVHELTVAPPPDGRDKGRHPGLGLAARPLSPTNLRHSIPQWIKQFEDRHVIVSEHRRSGPIRNDMSRVRTLAGRTAFVPRVGAALEQAIGDHYSVPHPNQVEALSMTCSVSVSWNSTPGRTARPCEFGCSSPIVLSGIRP